MRHILAKLTIISIFFPLWVHAKEIIDYDHLPFSQDLKNKIVKDYIIVQSEIDSLKDKKQKFDFQVAALHTKSCNIALRKLSRYETYSKYIDFIDRSSYDDKSGKVYFRLKSALLPYTMVLQFKLERIYGPGVYHFQFDYGFLKGLKGEIHVSEFKNRCLFYSHAKWQGPDTKIPDLAFEFFTKALSKILVNKLFSISRF